MSTVYLPVIPPTLPPDYCFTTFQQFVADSVGRALVSFTGEFTTIVVGSTTPAATQRGSPWFRTTDDRLYRWEPAVSKWVSRHRLAPASQELAFWEGNLTDLQTHDGGDSNPVADASGPMWEEHPDYRGRCIIAPGTLPGSGTLVSVGGTGGSDQTTLAAAMLPDARITVNLPIIGMQGVGSPEPIVDDTYGKTDIVGAGRAVDGTVDDLAGRYYTKGQTDPLGAASPVPVTPPFRSAYVIRRTGRIFYAA